MKGTDNHIIEIFKKYFSGTASRIDLRQIEEEAQENPYVKDAKEGVDKMSTVNRNTTITNINERLTKRIGNKQSRKTPLPWLKLAAGLALLLSVGFFIWRPMGENSVATNESNNTRSKVEISANNSNQIDNVEKELILTKDQENQIAIDGIAISADKLDGNPFDIPSGTKLKKQESNFSTQKIDAENVSDFIVQFPPEESLTSEKTQDTNRSYPGETVEFDIQVYNQGSVSADDVGIENYAEAIDANITPSSQEPVDESEQNDFDQRIASTEKNNSAKKKTRSEARSNSELSSSAPGIMPNISTRSISGIIMDDSGEALIGANVSVDNTTIGTITGIDGSFTLDVPEDANSLFISYTGFDSQTLILSDENQIEISLSQGIELSEVVVTELGSGKSDDINQNSYPDSPEGGLSQFKEYINTNLNYPEEAKQNNIKGKVILLFDIDDSGKPINIEVKKSLGYGCDEEAIRLLKEGPIWKEGNRVSKTKLVIKFK